MIGPTTLQQPMTMTEEECKRRQYQYIHISDTENPYDETVVDCKFPSRRVQVARVFLYAFSLPIGTHGRTGSGGIGIPSAFKAPLVLISLLGKIAHISFGI